MRNNNILFENKGDGTFIDISINAGFTTANHSSGATFFDYNSDGLLDLFVCNVGTYTYPDRIDSVEITGESFYFPEGFKDGFAGHLFPERAEGSILYKNIGGNEFVNVTEEVNLLDYSWTGDAYPTDINNDGFIDLYILNMQGNDEYYENIEGKEFKKKSREYFPKTPFGSMGIGVFDFDNDGDQDIYITDMHSDMGYNASPGKEKEKMQLANTMFMEKYINTKGNSILGNAFYKKNDAESFEEISDKLNAENYWPWGLSVADINADGYEDVFITSSMNYPFRYQHNSLLLNDKGVEFLDSEFILGIEPRLNNRYAKEWFKADCSGADMNAKYCDSLSNKQIIYSSLGSRSSVIFDFDNDGDLDIITNEFNDRPMVMVSNLSDKKNINYLKIKLEGITSNKDGLGAVVKVFTEQNTYTKVHSGKSGYLSQSSQLLYFGLGNTSKIDSIEIKWPSGKTQTISNINSNQTLVIKEL